VSYDLVVLSIADDADDVAVRAMAERCRETSHPEGELDERIVAFYEELRVQYPDYPPYPVVSPWMSMPLDVGIDHVTMYMSYSSGNGVVDTIEHLAARHGLVIYDPQFDEVFRLSN